MSEKKWTWHLSWRYNGFGFMFLWIDNLYIQFGTVKLMVLKPIEPVEPVEWPTDPPRPIGGIKEWA